MISSKTKHKITLRCFLASVFLSLITPVEDFIDVFLRKLTELKPHSFIATRQSLFFKNMRENLEPGVVLIAGDFAENYHIDVQMRHNLYIGLMTK